jgi:hypothetical protein
MMMADVQQVAAAQGVAPRRRTTSMVATSAALQ